MFRYTDDGETGMYDENLHSFCNEFYTVEKVIEVVVNLGGQSRRVRISALRDPKGKFSTRAQIEEDITVQPTYPQSNGQFTNKPVSHRVWVVLDFPWTDRTTADDALRQALGFLRDMCK
jgi:hypothetical protein